jgi:hypothetical protein
MWAAVSLHTVGHFILPGDKRVNSSSSFVASLCLVFLDILFFLQTQLAAAPLDN